MNRDAAQIQPTREILLDAFSRVAEELPDLLAGLTPEGLLWQPDPQANSIAWLSWHLSRVADDHLAGVGDVEQVWRTGGWSARFALPYDEADIGYGQSAADASRFAVTDVDLLTGYHADVHRLTTEVVNRLGPADLQRIVDRRWNPPVTAAVRLVSVVNDTTQHLGQIAYLRGMLERGAATHR